MKTLVHKKAEDIEPGDLVRGINHSRIVTGPPVRVIRIRAIGYGLDVIRVSYFIIGRNEYGWRDISIERGVTVEVNV